MVTLRNLDNKEIENFIESIGEPKFRGKQVFQWVAKGVSNFEEMKNVPKNLQQKLSENSNIGALKISSAQKSQKDGTVKFLFELSDGNFVESVFMKYKHGNSICVSSQVGCKMGCRFCASALNGYVRNLEAGEIIAQILDAQKYTGEAISHIVVMGTGEPLDNYDNLSKFINLVNNKEGMNVSKRNITVSTCGIVPKIKAFARDFPQVNLAISLHSTNDASRSKLMPINDVYGIKELIEACKEYGTISGRRITFEYTLIKDENNTRVHLEELVKLLRGINCHVNIIKLNKVEETKLEGAHKDFAIDFQKRLEKAGIVATIRRELGSDIDAACGQLRMKKINF